MLFWHKKILCLSLIAPLKYLSALAVMETRKCSPVKASSWLLIGSWSEVTGTSLFLSLPGEKSSHALMLSSQVSFQW